MEHALLRVHAQEIAHITIVRESGTETNNSSWFTSLLPSTNGSADKALNDRTTFIVKEVNFINDDKTDKVDVACFRRLSCDNIEFFGGCDDNLGIGNLLFR